MVVSYFLDKSKAKDVSYMKHGFHVVRLCIGLLMAIENVWFRGEIGNRHIQLTRLEGEDWSTDAKC